MLQFAYSFICLHRLFSSFWVLWIKLLWIFVPMSLYGHMFSFFLGNYLRVDLLGIFIFNFIRTFPKWLCHFTFPLAMYGSSSFSMSPLTLGIVNFYNFSHSSKCVMWYGYLVCISLMCNDIDIFSCADWSFVYIFKQPILIFCPFKIYLV